MTSRKWLIQQNEYDLLCRMQKRLQDGQEKFCVIYLITGDDARWVKCDERKCKSCIQKWLNEDKA